MNTTKKPVAVESEKTIINLRTKTLVLEIKDFGGSNIEIEDLLQIDYANILGDIITFPVIFNRIANLKAEMDNILREEAFDQKVFEAQLYEELKKKLLGLGEKATETAIDMAVKRDPRWKVKSFEFFKVQKQADILDGLYWAAKSKSKMLEAVSMKIRPEDFEKEILADTINSVKIVAHKNHFEQRR
jgi:hypothetical protein